LVISTGRWSNRLNRCSAQSKAVLQPSELAHLALELLELVPTERRPMDGSRGQEIVRGNAGGSSRG
jgi:hypothetical protein